MAGFFVIDIIESSDTTVLVGEHGEGDSAFNHFGEFNFIPNLVGKNTVYTDGEHFYIEFLQLWVANGYV